MVRKIATDVGLLAALDVLVARLTAAGCRPASKPLSVSCRAFPPLLAEFDASAVVGGGA